MGHGHCQDPTEPLIRTGEYEAFVLNRTLEPMMRAILILSALCLPLRAHAQGNISFDNYGIMGGAPRAPIYGPELNDAQEQKWGNAPNADPPGTQAYTGAPLNGSGYSVEAWYSLTPVSDVYALAATATAAPSTKTAFDLIGAGYFAGHGLIPVSWGTSPVYLQVRAWDNASGQYGTWDEAWNAAQAGSGRAVGWSKVFLQPLAFGAAQPEGLYNFESFNLFIVPEPSSSALFGLGGLALLFLHGRK
jgi:hypothetical protein